MTVRVNSLIFRLSYNLIFPLLQSLESRQEFGYLETEHKN